MANNITKKQESLIKDLFVENFDAIIQSEIGRKAIKEIVELNIHEMHCAINSGSLSYDTQECINQLKMSERIQSTLYKQGVA